MTREQLEALIWRAFRAYNVQPAAADVRALLAAADSYADADAHRAELARAMHKPLRQVA